MEAFLVMRNNLKRVLKNKLGILLFVLLPLLITGTGMLGNGITQKTIRVGLIHPTKELEKQLKDCGFVQLETANTETVQTDFIMGRYHYVIDGAKSEETQETVTTLLNKEGSADDTNSLSAFQRFMAMLLTAYMVIATVYAAKFILDRENGMLGRVKCAGVKTGKYLLGYILSTEIIVAVQVALALVFFLIFNPEVSINFSKLLVAVLFISMVATLYAAVHVLLCKREMTANIMASSLAAILSIFGGTFVAIEQMPQFMQILSIISPIQWLLQLL